MMIMQSLNVTQMNKRGKKKKARRKRCVLCICVCGREREREMRKGDRKLDR